jgi:hypothetical protein
MGKAGCWAMQHCYRVHGHVVDVQGNGHCRYGTSGGCRFASAMCERTGSEGVGQCRTYAQVLLACAVVAEVESKQMVCCTAVQSVLVVSALCTVVTAVPWVAAEHCLGC